MSSTTSDTHQGASHNDQALRKATIDLRKLAVKNPNIAHISHEAKNATQWEKSMTFSQAIRLYPKAVAWSVLLSAALIMDGYDIAIIGQFFAFPAFAQKYGSLDTKTNTYQLTSAWQTALTNGQQAGEILGLFAAGFVVDRFGYRKTMIGALSLTICFVFIPFFAQNLATLLAGEILLGLPWGVFQTMTTAYASEVCPVALRAYLTTYVNLCWVIGQLLASGILRALLTTRNDQWAYRIPFAIQWVWPVPILIGVLFAPESPWWYIRKDRVAEAKASLLRLTTAGKGFNADETIAMMIHTNEIEKQLSAGTSYLDCFRGTNLRRTEIASITWMAQTLSGSGLMSYSTYFFKAAGLKDTPAYNLSIGQYALGAVGVLGSWFLMERFGRRTLYLSGLIFLFTILLIIGFLGVAPSSDGVSWAIGSMILVYTFAYDFTIGPVCFSLVAEIPSTRMKQKTVVLARDFYLIAGILNNIVTPRMLNPTAWNWGAKAAFFWAVTCFIMIVWTYFRLPEPKGRTYGELDILFENGVSARKFAGTVADQFSVSVDHLAIEENKTKREGLDSGEDEILIPSQVDGPDTGKLLAREESSEVSDENARAKLVEGQIHEKVGV